MLPGWFSDGMVLQDGGPPAQLGGITQPAGERVTVSGDAGSATTVSDAETGRWRVQLPDSSTWTNRHGMTVVVRGATGPAATATNVLPGDAFFCSGQPPRPKPP